MRASDVILFSGNANPDLAQKISDKLGIPLSSRVLKPFADGEVSWVWAKL